MKMLFLLSILCCYAFLFEAAILHCDFETPCDDFIPDTNWGWTDGLHPQSINHDHTLNTSLGHYFFYNPPDSSRSLIAQIESNSWIEPSIDRPLCFRMWYYTPRLHFPFNIQLVQGDDEQLVRIVASIPGKDPSTNDWAPINITLPNEKIKIFIRLNVTAKPLVFDDLSVDYCDGPRPIPPKIMYNCDFESSCSNDFASLPLYPYQWFALNASDAVKMDGTAPSVDFTFGNASGHYAVVPNSKITGVGNVGYLHLQKELQISSEVSYCLNFQYYSHGQAYQSHLYIYLWTSNQPKTVQMLWPGANAYQYTYMTDSWTWGIINLPVGNYSLLFRVDLTDGYVPRLFALDNISITSCDYQPYELSPYSSLLSFSCNFDDESMCDMINDDRFSTPTYNFTVLTGDTVPNKTLGPTRDHTTNSTTGAFLYWNQHTPYTPRDFGQVCTSQTVEQNTGMCIKFAYYVKSVARNKNGTRLSLSAGGCYGGGLWYQSLDDSQGWQLATIPVSNFACAETYCFNVNQGVLAAVSVAFDDIQIDQCTSLIPTTTTTTTSTSTSTTTTITTTQTTTMTSTSTTTTISSATTTQTTASTSTPISTTMTTPSSNAYRLLSFNRYCLIMICLYLEFFKNMF